MPFGNARTQGFNSPAILNFQVGGVVINKNGLFIYNGPPAANNLKESLPFNGGGTDPKGNVYLDGYTEYSFVSGSWIAINILNGAIQWYTSLTEAGPWVAQAGIAADSIGTLDLNSVVFGDGTETNLELGDKQFLFQILGLTGGLDGFEFIGGTGLVAQTNGVAETWNTLTVAAPWTNNVTDPIRYRLLPDGTVEFTGAATAVAQAGTTTLSASPLLAVYRPAIAQDIGPALVNANIVQGVNVSTAGVVSVRSPTGTTTLCSPQGFYPIGLQENHAVQGGKARRTRLRGGQHGNRG